MSEWTPDTILDWLLLVVPWTSAITLGVWSHRRTRREEGAK